MDQSYFRFLFRLARKSKQSGLPKSEKSLAKRNATSKSFEYTLLCMQIIFKYTQQWLEKKYSDIVLETI